MDESHNPDKDSARAEQLRLLEPHVEGRPEAMVALARQYAAIGDRPAAIDLAARALAGLPGDSDAATLAAELLSDGVPSWHFGLLRDEVRNRAYDAAIRRAVTPGCTVLEIGTGSGILAMMAARAGARVVTCESNPSVAAAARAVILANGLADRITVIDKPSFALDPAIDLPGPADVLVSEIVSNDLLSEGVLSAHGDAVARLLKPGAQVIPARGRVRVALAHDRHWADARICTVEGFDLSPVNRLARPYREVGTGSARIELRSAPADLFSFDFGTAGPWRDGRTRLALPTSGGVVNGVVQWIALDLDDCGIYENSPDEGARSCWAALFWPFSHPVESHTGESLTIGAYHTEDRIRLWREQSCDSN